MIYSWAKMLNTTPRLCPLRNELRKPAHVRLRSPSYDDEEAEEWDDRLDANNPDNFNDNADEEEEFI